MPKRPILEKGESGGAYVHKTHSRWAKLFLPVVFTRSRASIQPPEKTRGGGARVLIHQGIRGVFAYPALSPAPARLRVWPKFWRNFDYCLIWVPCSRLSGEEGEEAEQPRLHGRFVLFRDLGLSVVRSGMFRKLFFKARSCWIELKARSNFRKLFTLCKFGWKKKENHCMAI